MGEGLRVGRRFRVWSLTLLTAFGLSCATSSSVPDGGSDSATQAQGTSSGAVAATSGPASSASALPSASAARAAEADKFRFADLVNDLSEPDTYFFSDNLISNETSFLQTASELSKRADPSGVYIGVGPEQNFSYIALSRPNLAFVVDIRRANMLLHLLYRAAFEEATNRAQFVALLVGRDPGTTAPLPDTAGIDGVMASVSKAGSSKASYDTGHAKLMKRIDGYGVKLSAEDRTSISKMHKTFFEEQLKIKFELKKENGRNYPTLRELLETKSPDGTVGSFLATDDAFKFLQSMERAGRIVPIVGDFAGDHAILQLASYLKTENRRVSVFYVSNVEQYLLEPKMWKKWVRNVKALPKTEQAIFVRAYLDQGKKHPNQMKGHRTATVLAKMSDFETLYGDKTTTTFWTLCTEKNVAPAG